MDVQKWKTTCLMKLDTHKSTHYNSFVTRNSTNEIFSTFMLMEKSTQRFNITHQALDPAKCNLEFIKRQMIDTSDGLHLWEMIK